MVAPFKLVQRRAVSLRNEMMMTMSSASASRSHQRPKRLFAPECGDRRGADLFASNKIFVAGYVVTMVGWEGGDNRKQPLETIERNRWYRLVSSARWKYTPRRETPPEKFYFFIIFARRCVCMWERNGKVHAYARQLMSRLPYLPVEEYWWYARSSLQGEFLFIYSMLCICLRRFPILEDGFWEKLWSTTPLRDFPALLSCVPSAEMSKKFG